MIAPVRSRTLATIAASVTTLLAPGTVVLVAVDGVDGAGKTVLADELRNVLVAEGRRVLRVSVDGFHRPAAERYRRGRSSPDGFYLDSYDLPSLCRLLLDPLGPGGDRQIVRAIHDVDQEQPVQERVEHVDVDIAIVDGIFLHRLELRDRWDYSVFLDVPFAVSVPRGAARHDGNPDPEAPVNRRYVDGQRRYLRECEPRARASVVVDNTHLDLAYVAGPFSS